MSIETGSFAEACYDTNTIQELKDSLKGPADKTDCKTWGISAGEWRRQINIALEELKSDE